MSPLSVILLTRLRMVKNILFDLRNEPLTKVIFVSSVSLFLFAGFSIGIYMGLGYLETSSPFGPFILGRVISFYLMVLFVMLIFSNLITGYSIFYSSKEGGYLFSLPLSHTQVFTTHLLSALFLASWPFTLFALPLILSYGLIKALPLYFYPLSFLLFLPFILIPATIGMLSALLLRRAAIIRAKKAAFLAIILLPFLYLLFRSHASQEGRDSYYFLQGLLEGMRLSASSLLPSRWVSLGMELVGEGDLAGWGYYLLLLLANGLMGLMVLLLVSSRLYYDGWCNHETPYRVRGWVCDLPGWFVRLFPVEFRALAEKDIKGFLRDPYQWSQFLIFFALLLVYIGNLRDMEAGVYTPLWKAIVLFTNLAGIGFILAALTTRFIFPLFSLEGMRFWIIGLSPLPLRTVIIEKLLLSIVLCGGMSLFLVVVSSLILKTRALPFMMTSMTILLMSVSMAGLSVGLGTIFANMKADSPARIVSGIGGTINAIASLLYVGIVTLVEAVPVFLYTLGRIRPTLYYTLCGLAGLIILTISLSILILPLRAGFRAIKEMEF
jgi:ABC-2 type transport system permease protein